MKKRTRYLILLICFLIFLGLAPVLVYFVRGVKYDGANGRFSPTGLISVETEPKGADIFLNGEKVAESNASVRFLPAGDYGVSISKSGYFSWMKRLTVQEGKVTWANPNPTPLYLIKEGATEQALVSGANAFFLLDGAIGYTTSSGLSLLSGPDFKNSQSFPLPSAVRDVTVAPSRKSALVRTQNQTFQLNLNERSLTPITPHLPPEAHISLLSDNAVLVLEDGELQHIDLQKKQITPLVNSVSSFGHTPDSLYVLQTTSSSSTLLISNLANLTELNPLVLSLPLFKHAQLLATFQKQLFIVGDGTLFRINNTLEPLLSNVTGFNFDPNNSSLILTTPGELHYYNTGEQKIRLIARSNEPFTNPVLKTSHGYAFTFHQQSLKAVELDDRDHQNTYTLSSLTDPKQFTFINGEKIVVQDGGVLKIVTVF